MVMAVEAVRHRPEDLVEPAVALLCLPAVSLDPRGHQVEGVGFQVYGMALGVSATAHESGVPEYLQVLGDGLKGHVVGLGEFVDGGVGDR